MNAIDQLEEQLNTESDRISARVRELKQANVNDQQILITYADRFAEAVQDEAGDKELAELEAQRNEAQKRVEQNEEIIRILTSSEGSKIQRLRAELVGEQFKAIAEIENQAAVLHKKMIAIREQLIAGARELKALSDLQIDHMRKIDRIPLDKVAMKQYGLVADREIDGQRGLADDLKERTVATMLQSLLFRPFTDIE